MQFLHPYKGLHYKIRHVVIISAPHLLAVLNFQKWKLETPVC